MVVPPLTLASLALATLVIAALPFLIYRQLRRPLALRPRDAIAGVAVFALFAMVIERGLNDYLLRGNEASAAFLAQPLAFVVYGALTAGVCEEVGRFFGMRLLVKRATARPAPRRKANVDANAGVDARAGTSTAASTAASATADTRTAALRADDGAALSYGLGHGGAEAWLVGVLVQCQWLVFAVLENRGRLGDYLGNLPAEAVMRVHLILASLTPQLAGIFALERIAALVFQIGLSVLMWRGVRAGSRGILPLAIVVHALLDVPAAMTQARLLPLAAADTIYAVAALFVAGLLIRIYRRPVEA
ncbi:YhfC family intramembrane metalloprotease [Paraburkholderia sprentiae WSM5005]|uniref:YhfC family intramembrane metalloprotease n=1 Tax=Paraburkholderia sprentiae WSM5005 TaxID=754502 RepID=A0A1I9YEB1_9BURK|nr:YhfC family intramembrane metalloprotease [Paraburkholderia sprentiae]APA84644.1 YhfC family intramembrane metalloprotease [Paraburkholderia sprentiae WSM5005]